MKFLKSSLPILQAIFDEAIDWLRQLDNEYHLTTPDYTIDDFIEDLKNKGYIREELDPTGDGDGKGKTTITAKLNELSENKP